MAATDVIRKRMADLGLSASGVARQSGLISPRSLRASLSGQRRLMATEFIGLCQVLHLSLEDFRPPPSALK